jgi:hypothetical protein
VERRHRAEVGELRVGRRERGSAGGCQRSTRTTEYGVAGVGGVEKRAFTA